MNDYQSWLETPSAVRGILVIANVSAYNSTTLVWETLPVYLSNIGYLTKDSSVSFLPIITGGANFSEAISIDGSLNMSFGDLELYNPNGEYDEWLDSSRFIWVNQPIQVFYGDPLVDSDNLADITANTFEKIFDGIIADMDAKSRTSLNIKVRDKLERLNTPATENTIGTYGVWAQGQTNQDNIKPVILGEVHNITPVLVDPSTLEYLVNDGLMEQVIEVRDNGVPITPGSINLTNGTFKLANSSNGQITLSAQGTRNEIDLLTGTVGSNYSNSVAKLIATICLYYGNPSSRLEASDIDFANFYAFQQTHTQPVGYLISDRENVLNICTSLASSLGAQLYFNRLGLLQLLQLGVYTPDTVVSITDSDILLHSLEISNRTQVVATTKVGYCKNWTVQPSLVTNIPMAHKTMYALEWYVTTSTDSAIKNAYKLSTDPVQKDTLLLKGTDADSEALRLNTYFKVPRTVYRMTGISKLLSLKLGQEVLLVHKRFGLSAGKSGQVISLAPNWLKSTIDIEVIV